jgi:outer membrane immunogenic protein
MKKVLGLVGATWLLAGPTLAADLAVKAPPLTGPLPAQWSGFYLGIHGGYGWGHDSLDAEVSPATNLSPISGFSNPSPKGGVFGGQAGYNWQNGTFVGGLEIDASGADLTDSQSTVLVFPGPRGFNETDTLSSKIDFLASARARAGFLLTPDWLVYGTAGLGLAHDSITKSVTFASGVSNTSSTAVNDHVGWTAGGGVEYRLWQNLLLRAEYLHYGFGSVHYQGNTGFGSPPLSFNSRLSVDVARGGLSYQF